MTQFTPGPWVWRDVADPEEWLYSESGVPVLVYAGCGSHACESTDANKALIAAAPEMYGVVEMAAMLSDSRLHRDDPALMALAERAARVLAKARGEA